jgi:hypothetical protein
MFVGLAMAFFSFVDQVWRRNVCRLSHGAIHLLFHPAQGLEPFLDAVITPKLSGKRGSSRTRCMISTLPADVGTSKVNTNCSCRCCIGGCCFWVRTLPTNSYVHRSSESPWRFQTKKLFGDFALENFLRKTVRNQPALSLESRSDSEEEGSGIASRFWRGTPTRTRRHRRTL